MSLKLTTVTFDCADPQRTAAFWSAALDRPVDEGGTDFFVSISGGDAAPGMFFIQVPEGKAVKNRVHVDLHAEDRAAEVERLVGLGASIHSEHEEYGTRWTTLLDVEGNEFCVAGG